MVGSSGGKMVVNSEKWPGSVCGKGVQTNSFPCTVCKNGFTSGAVVTCRGYMTISGICDVTGQSRKLI